MTLVVNFLLLVHIVHLLLVMGLDGWPAVAVDGSVSSRHGSLLLGARHGLRTHHSTTGSELMTTQARGVGLRMMDWLGREMMHRVSILWMLHHILWHHAVVWHIEAALVGHATTAPVPAATA
jgi:hypothetical protein